MSAIPESVSYHIANLPPSVLMSWLAWTIIIIPSLVVRFTVHIIPKRIQSLFEMGFEMIFDMADEFIGKEAPRYYALFAGIFLYILVSNLMGLIPGFMSPTSDLNTTVALAIIVFVYYNIEGFRVHGVKYFKHFLGPPLPAYLFPLKILMVIIEIIGTFARPFSLALRLFCNILSKEMLLGIMAFLLVKFFLGTTVVEKALVIAPFLLRPLITVLGVLISFIQALIFLVLSMAYIAGAVKQEEHG